MAEEKKDVAIVKEIEQDIKNQLGTPADVQKLLATTFDKFDETTMRAALFSGGLRGFKVLDFFNKNVYAIKYGTGFNLVTSIDWSRKIGQKNGVVGTDDPVYATENIMGKDDVSCLIVVHKMTDGHEGLFKAKVFLSEFTTGQNQWKTKPLMMIAKVAEMHALRKACPEDLSGIYTAEEFDRQPGQSIESVENVASIDIDAAKGKVKAAVTFKELKDVYDAMTPEERNSEGMQELLAQRKVEINSTKAEKKDGGSKEA